MAKIKGRGTSLISVYCPPGQEQNTLNRLNSEISTARNVKSRVVRKDVLKGLKKMIEYLKKNKPFEKGIALFTSGKELHVIYPRYEIFEKIYYCDGKFYIRPLKKMLEPQKIVGLVNISKDRAVISKEVNGREVILKKMSSPIPRKTRKGGMSQKRYQRIHKEAVREFHKKVMEKSKMIFGRQGIS